MPPHPREKKPYPELGPRWMIQKKPCGIKPSGATNYRKHYFSPQGLEFYSLAAAEKEAAARAHLSGDEGAVKEEEKKAEKKVKKKVKSQQKQTLFHRSQKRLYPELGPRWMVQEKPNGVKGNGSRKWCKTFFSPGGQVFTSLSLAKAHLTSEKEETTKKTAAKQANNVAEASSTSDTQDEGEVEEKKGESKESTKRKRIDSDDDTSASSSTSSGALSSTLQDIYHAALPSFGSPPISEPMDIDGDDVEQRPKVKRTKVSDSSRSSSTSESLSTLHTLQDIGDTILPTFPTSTGPESSGASLVRSSGRSNKKAKHRPVDPEERIRSHGEDEGGEVSERERSRKLVSEERKRIGNKNSRKRRGIGKRRKREIRDQQFKEM